MAATKQKAIELILSCALSSWRRGETTSTPNESYEILPVPLALEGFTEFLLRKHQCS